MYSGAQVRSDYIVPASFLLCKLFRRTFFLVKRKKRNDGVRSLLKNGRLTTTIALVRRWCPFNIQDKYEIVHEIMQSTYSFVELIGSLLLFRTVGCSNYQVLADTSRMLAMAQIHSYAITISRRTGIASKERQESKCFHLARKHPVVVLTLLGGWAATILQWKRVKSPGRSVSRGVIAVPGRSISKWWIVAISTFTTSMERPGSTSAICATAVPTKKVWEFPRDAGVCGFKQKGIKEWSGIYSITYN